MTANKQPDFPQNFDQAIAALVAALNMAGENVQRTALVVEDILFGPFHRMVEQSTETIGRIATPIAENPFIKYTTKVPGLKWIMAALGQVNVAEVERAITNLRQKYPADTNEQLVYRVIQETAMAGGGVGLVTNLLPPFAVGLFAIDLAAVSALQAEMIYKIAATYGFPLNEPSRRGEVLAIYGLSLGGSGLIKTGLSIVEIIPGVGFVIGAAGNATLLFSLGHIANRFYARKAQESKAAAAPKDVEIF
jgi:uncharacterized protein (DUF697 family)